MAEKILNNAGFKKARGPLHNFTRALGSNAGKGRFERRRIEVKLFNVFKLPGFYNSFLNLVSDI